VNTPCDELDQLHTCDVFFPPKIFLDRGTEAGHEVVEVHDDMDTDVEEHEECGVSTSNKLEEEPYNNWHHGMVDNMKGGHLVVLMPHHMKKVSMKSVNLEKKYHHTVAAMKVPSLEFE